MTAETAGARVLSLGRLGHRPALRAPAGRLRRGRRRQRADCAEEPGAEVMFGYTAAEVRGLAVEVLVPERLKEGHRTRLVGYHATGHGAIVDAGAMVEVPARHKS